MYILAPLRTVKDLYSITQQRLTLQFQPPARGAAVTLHGEITRTNDEHQRASARTGNDEASASTTKQEA
jgi:hypothetical protein